ncbi:hypothetical protein NVP2275O_094 [Vibrio phage 2.275.O._10N.286.54.E11]|nr:hypothetical protein NVP2275O_094 [Vibrio phage 2.275.O._10N.286.54.E11]
MSAIQMILHASHICADVERDIDSIFDAMVSEIGELAEEKRIANGKSYKAPGPDGMDGETIDVLAATVDMIDRLTNNATEQYVIDKLRPKLRKWLVKTGTNIPDDDPYFGTSITTFEDLEFSFGENGYDIVKYQTSYRIHKCGSCAYQTVHTIAEAQIVLDCIKQFGLS